MRRSAVFFLGLLIAVGGYAFFLPVHTRAQGSCPFGQVDLSTTSIDIGPGYEATSEAPAGWTGGRFDSADPGVAQIIGSATVRGVRGGSTTISGSGWIAPGGIGPCSLAPRPLAVKDFELRVSPPFRSAVTGQPVDFTISIQAINNFSHAITLEQSGAPSSALFSRTSITPNEAAQLSFIAPASGRFTINVRGTWSGLQRSDAAQFEVTGGGTCPGTGTVLLAPDRVNVGEWTIARAPAEYRGGTFGATPAGPIAAISPLSDQEAVVRAGSNGGFSVINGSNWNYTGTPSANNCSLNGANLSIQDFKLQTSFLQRGIAGQSANISFSVMSENGFDGMIILSQSGAPGTGPFVFSPPSVQLSPASPSARVTLNFPIPSGLAQDSQHDFAIIGTATGVAGVTRELTVRLVINTPPSSGCSAVTLQMNPSSSAFDVTQTATVTGLQFAPNSPTVWRVSQNLTLVSQTRTSVVVRGTEGGNGTVTASNVTSRDGTTGCSASRYVAVRDFRVRAIPVDQTIQEGNPAAITVSVHPFDPAVGFSQTVTLSMNGNPPGSTLTQTSGVTPYSASLPIPASTPSGVYTITITGAYNNHMHIAQAIVRITPSSVNLQAPRLSNGRSVCEGRRPVVLLEYTQTPPPNADRMEVYRDGAATPICTVAAPPTSPQLCQDTLAGAASLPEHSYTARSFWRGQSSSSRPYSIAVRQCTPEMNPTITIVAVDGQPPTGLLRISNGSMVKFKVTLNNGPTAADRTVGNVSVVTTNPRSNLHFERETLNFSCPTCRLKALNPPTRFSFERTTRVEPNGLFELEFTGRVQAQTRQERELVRIAVDGTFASLGSNHQITRREFTFLISPRGSPPQFEEIAP